MFAQSTCTEAACESCAECGDDGSQDCDTYGGLACGCMDSSACNYNPAAEMDDGTCYYDCDIYYYSDSTSVLRRQDPNQLIKLEKQFAGKISPNPTNGKFLLEVDANESGSTNIQIINLKGQVLFSNTLPLPKGKYRKQFDLALPNGTYFLKGLLNGRSFQEKIIIQK